MSRKIFAGFKVESKRDWPRIPKGKASHPRNRDVCAASAAVADGPNGGSREAIFRSRAQGAGISRSRHFCPRPAFRGRETGNGGGPVPPARCELRPVQDIMEKRGDGCGPKGKIGLVIMGLLLFSAYLIPYTVLRDFSKWFGSGLYWVLFCLASIIAMAWLTAEWRE